MLFGMFYIGCPMWGYTDWLGSFFPARTAKNNFLRIYSRQLTSVEGNTIFYALPSKETIEHWAQETPETFRFCPKIPRSISHEAAINLKVGEIALFIERMRSFGSRLGPIFLQLPPSFGPAQLTQLETFLDRWPADLRLAVEVRHPDFYAEKMEDPEDRRSTPQERLNTLLSHHNVGRVIMDTRPIRTGSVQEQDMLQARERKPNLPVRIAATTDFAFVRYIGHPRMEINEPFLTTWALQLAQWYKEGKTLYVFCHCPFEEHSPTICFELYHKVKALVPLPPLSWQPHDDDTKPEQMSLF
ncbi:MAG: DUF72 domain-containing protein [Ktedonobacteraceae bacterium]